MEAERRRGEAELRGEIRREVDKLREEVAEVQVIIVGSCLTLYLIFRVGEGGREAGRGERGTKRNKEERSLKTSSRFHLIECDDGFDDKGDYVMMVFVTKVRGKVKRNKDEHSLKTSSRLHVIM